MQAIDNSNLLNYRDVGIADFTPDLSYDYDASAKEIDITDNGTSWPTGVALKKAKVQVFDKFGGEVRGEFGPGAGSDSGAQTTTTIDVDDLDRSKPLDIKVTLIGDDDKTVADGGAYNVTDGAGTIGSWDRQVNA